MIPRGSYSQRRNFLIWKSTKNKNGLSVCIIAAIMLFMSGFSTQLCSAETSNASKPQAMGGLVRIPPASRYDDPFSGVSFETIYKSGFDVCTNIGGQPVVFLFTSSSCAHCKWLGKIFDVIAMNYIEDGSIEAHHYDVLTGDDLLTEEIETEIPSGIHELYLKGSPKDLVPYLNFSCKYERVGTGHEKDQDADAEGQEIIDVIETLIRVLSAE